MKVYTSLKFIFLFTFLFVHFIGESQSLNHLETDDLFAKAKQYIINRNVDSLQFLLNDRKKVLKTQPEKYYYTLSSLHILNRQEFSFTKKTIDSGLAYQNVNINDRAMLYNNHGTNNLFNGFLQEALNFYDTAIQITTDSVQKIKINTNKINIYNTLKQYDRSIEFIRSTYGDIKTYEVNSLIYYLMANAFYGLEQSDSAITYYNLCLNSLNSKNLPMTCACYSVIGKSYARKKEYSSAEKYFKLAIDSCETNKTDRGTIYNIYASSLIEQKKYALAEKYANQAKQIFIETNNLHRLSNAHNKLYVIYKNTNRPFKSLEHYEQFILLSDSVNKVKLEENLKEIETKYETEKKQKEILALKQDQLEKDAQIAKQDLKTANQRIWIIVLITIVFLSLLGFYIWYSRKRLIQAKEKTDLQNELILLEQKALKSQINTHFIFNAIDSAQGFITEDNYKEARSCLVDVTRLVRLTLENASEPTVTLEDEIDCLKAFFNVSQTLYNNKFTYSIEINEDIEIDNVLIPPMIIQPFIENAIIHGALPSTNSIHIILKLSLDNEILNCSIIDDGVGIDYQSETKNPLKRKSMGMAVTKKRIEKNNQEHNIDTNISITNNNLKGTIVSFKLFTTPAY